jgi:hypothetical protein
MLVPARTVHGFLVNGQCLPPEAEVKEGNWHYYPCPDSMMNFDGPFISTLLDPGHALEHDVWTLLFPKKLKAEFWESYQNKESAWGIHIIDGLNPSEIAWVSLLVLLASGLFGLVYSLVTQDPGTGFTIASWLATTTALAITCLQLRSK